MNIETKREFQRLADGDLEDIVVASEQLRQDAEGDASVEELKAGFKQIIDDLKEFNKKAPPRTREGFSPINNRIDQIFDNLAVVHPAIGEWAT